MFLDKAKPETEGKMIRQSKFHTCHLIPVQAYSSNTLGLLNNTKPSASKCDFIPHSH